MLYLVEALIKLKWNFANFEYAYQIVCITDYKGTTEITYEW